MHYGPLDPRTGLRRWNYEIVHRDFKPQNGLCSPFLVDSWRPSNSLLVFLGNEGSYFSAFPFYPTAKVGDFGLAERTNGMDPNNPRGLQGAGTRAYMAPVSSWCDKSAGPWRLSSLSGTETSPERGPRLFLRPTWDLRCSYQCMGRWRHYV